MKRIVVVFWFVAFTFLPEASFPAPFVGFSYAPIAKSHPVDGKQFRDTNYFGLSLGLDNLVNGNTGGYFSFGMTMLEPSDKSISYYKYEHINAGLTYRAGSAIMIYMGLGGFTGKSSLNNQQEIKLANIDGGVMFPLIASLKGQVGFDTAPRAATFGFAIWY